MSDEKLNMHLFMYEAARLSDEAVDKYFSQHSRADRACICHWRDVEFEIGTGFDDAQRAYIWKHQNEYRGAQVKFKYQHLTPDQKPLFPVFLGMRDARD